MVTATRRTALQPVGLLLVLLAASPTRAPSSGGDIARAFAGAFSSPLGSAGVADAAQIKMQKPSQRDGYMPKEGKSKRRKGNGANSKKPLRPRKSRRARESWGVDGSPPPVCMSEYELCKSRRPKNFAAKRECLLSEYRQELSVRCLSYLELSRDCNMAALNQVCPDTEAEDLYSCVEAARREVIGEEDEETSRVAVGSYEEANEDSELEIDPDLAERLAERRLVQDAAQGAVSDQCFALLEDVAGITRAREAMMTRVMDPHGSKVSPEGFDEDHRHFYPHELYPNGEEF